MRHTTTIKYHAVVLCKRKNYLIKYVICHQMKFGREKECVCVRERYRAMPDYNWAIFAQKNHCIMWTMKKSAKE